MPRGHSAHAIPVEIPKLSLGTHVNLSLKAKTTRKEEEKSRMRCCSFSDGGPCGQSVSKPSTILYSLHTEPGAG